MFETVYHGVPIVSLPVFCDHDSNAAKAELDGYAIKLDLAHINSETLLRSIRKIMYDPKYKEKVKKMQVLLKDQKETPLEKAVYWTEYVLRHKGAEHLQSPARHMNFFSYYLIDVILLMTQLVVIAYLLIKVVFKIVYNYLVGNLSYNGFKKNTKLD